MLPRPPSVGLASKAGRKDGPRSQSAFWTLVPTPHAVPGGLRVHGPGAGRASSPPSPPPGERGLVILWEPSAMGMPVLPEV